MCVFDNFMFIVWLLLMIVDCFYKWLLIVSVVCINGGSSERFFWERLEKLILSLWKLWMSSINSVRNCKYSVFSKKVRVLKRLLKMRKKSALEPPFMYTTSV